MVIDTRHTRRTVTTVAIGMLGLAAMPSNRVAAAQPTGDSDPIEAAVALSGYEITDNLYPLYQRLHSDALAEIPFYAVRYWYETTFLPTGPELIEPTGVEYVTWTWEVTGVTYPDTAEVSYTQRFADGSTVEEVVRLVEQDGEWRWFFGRNREFVDEQIALGGDGLFPAEPTPAPDWVATLSGYGNGAIDGLPSEYPGAEDGTLAERESTGRAVVDRYVNQESYTIARVSYDTLFGNETAMTRVESELGQAARGATFSVETWDIREDAEVVYAMFRQDTGPVNQDFMVLVVASERLRSVWQISAPDEDAIEQIAAVLTV